MNAWRASVGGRGLECCQFECNGNKYIAYRTVGGPISKLCKRERTNARGAFYRQLNIHGYAARAVLAQVQL